MAVVDIVRDRERGLPRYNQARRQYGLQPAKTFSDITCNPMVLLFDRVYMYECMMPDLAAILLMFSRLCLKH